MKNCDICSHKENYYFCNLCKDFSEFEGLSTNGSTAECPWCNQDIDIELDGCNEFENSCEHCDGKIDIRVEYEPYFYCDIKLDEDDET